MTTTGGPTSSQGTTIKKSTGTAIAFLTSIDGLDIKADTIDTTALDTDGGYKTFINGFKEVSDVPISGFFDYAAHSQMLTDLQAGTNSAYTIQFPPGPGQTTGASWNFNAIVTEFHTKAAVDNVISFDATLKVSGAPTLVAGS
ncbi:phage tail tube protein [Pullulanibacillus sp. KACC 23026]|uniref:phage tail tube protein n=1 Tax=Pullulanibacillus sp. KACC 23026 TaxID=3028315 RepID=UPI0023AFB3FA|nr:phage tail tube protein [Pullulanibacillus sp. KACC 23026]WEG14005.1 phage tail tube protein [Pullulanibacillus sp. KACC 23026]